MIDIQWPTSEKYFVIMQCGFCNVISLRVTYFNLQ